MCPQFSREMKTEELLEDFAATIRKRTIVKRYNDNNPHGTYIVNGTANSFRNTSPIILLPFCIKNPLCIYRMQNQCDFSLDECKSDHTKDLIEILNDMHFSYYFNTNFEDVQRSIEKYVQKYGNLQSCVTICCPQEMLHIENEFINYINLYQIPVLVFFVGNYEGCRINGLRTRDFSGQTQVDIPVFRQTLKDLFL